jgi:hypothetical protein
LSTDDNAVHLHYHKPGGPSRILYLSSLNRTEACGEGVGFILSNGEKIGEWVHWFPFVRFGQVIGEEHRDALRAYELSYERPWTREGMPLATSPEFSILQCVNDDPDKVIIDIDRLERMRRPSTCRATLLIVTVDNSTIANIADVRGFRRIRFKVR